MLVADIDESWPLGREDFNFKAILPSAPTRLCDSATLKRRAFRDHNQHTQIIVILKDLESRRLEVFFVCYDSSCS